jgi:hypothetical protein
MSARLTRESVIGCGLMISLLVSMSCRSKSPESSVSKAVASVAPPGSAAGWSTVHELRQIWPQSGGVVLSARVEFRWWGGASHVELSRTRGFEKEVEQLAGLASASDPQRLDATSAELLDGLWFWRVSDAAGASRAVWSFRVRHVRGVENAGSTLDGTDLNCDGRPDILMNGGVWLGGDSKPMYSFALGPLAVKELLPEPGLPNPTWGQFVGIGDVDGDGCADVVTTATRQTHDMTVNIPVPVPILFRGRPELPTPWQAASRLAHELTPLGDLDADGYADTAACNDQDCTIFRGGPTGVVEAPFLTLKGYQTLLGGDFDADGIADLWAGGRTAAGHSRLSFFTGKSSFSSAPSSSFAIPLDLNGPPAGGLTINGKASILGFAGDGRSSSFWRVTDSSEAATVQRWPEAAHAASTWPRLNTASDWAFVPVTGPGARGVLLVIPMEVPAQWAPKQWFLQYGFSPTGTPFFLARSTISGLEQTEGVVGFSRIGDMNGDGYDDLLVQAHDSMGELLWYQYMGSATGFTFKQGL